MADTDVELITLTDEQMASIKARIDASDSDPGIIGAIATLRLLFGVEVWDQADPDELDPTSVPIPHDQWEQIAEWILGRQREIDDSGVVGAGLQWMNWGPSAG